MWSTFSLDNTVSLSRNAVFLQYLDGLFDEDPKAGGENHEMQVELYAKFDPEKLLPFLRSCNDIPLQKVHACRLFQEIWMDFMALFTVGVLHHYAAL